MENVFEETATLEFELSGGKKQKGKRKVEKAQRPIKDPLIQSF